MDDVGVSEESPLRDGSCDLTPGGIAEKAEEIQRKAGARMGSRER